MIMFLHCLLFLCHVSMALIFIKIGLNLTYFTKKYQSVGGCAPDPQLPPMTGAPAPDPRNRPLP